MSEPDEPLRRLVSTLAGAGLLAPAALLLDALRPLDVISSQLARFSRPLVGGTRAEPFVIALEDAAAWAELRRLMELQD
ncbi:MAG: hypothetical protein HGA45_42180 [Chloroflexales bacterium]|nr:hypothetical protein [Chloroflexales bacterium]